MPKVPPLEGGDRLKLAEYFRRYEATGETRHFELIEGIVYCSGRVSSDHASAHSDLAGITGYYRALTPHVKGAIGPTIKLDDRNCPEPDLVLWIRTERGGQVSIQDGYLVGAPELIGEIAMTSVSRELHDKRIAFERAGVREYIVWRVWDKVIDWFVLQDGRYRRLEPDGQGVLKSMVFPGLWIHPRALLDGDLPRVFEVLKQGIATSEHDEFARVLDTRRSRLQ